MFKSFLAVLALLLFSFDTANSREITEGTASVFTNNGFVSIVIQASGADFSVSAGGSNLFGIGFAPCTTNNLCSAGQIFNLSAFSGQWDFSDLSGSMTIDGTQYFFVNQTFATLPNVVGNGSVGFSGGSVMIPLSDDAPTITLKAPFTMSGSLSGRATGILGVGLSLTGRGIATLVLTRGEFGGATVYGDQSLVYTFGVPVDVDIKPNHINPRSRGKTPVVILSTEDFDASAIDPDTVTVAGAPIDVRPNGTHAAALQDINGDGLLDLVVHINTTALQLTSFNSEVLVEGFTFDGQYFFGTDIITVE